MEEQVKEKVLSDVLKDIKNSKEKKHWILAFVIATPVFFSYFLFCVWWASTVFRILYGWFVLPMFPGAPNLNDYTISQTMGLYIVTRFLVTGLILKAEKMDLRAWLLPLTGPLLMLTVGSIIHFILR